MLISAPNLLNRH